MGKSLVLLKPDALKRDLIGEIIKRFEDKGLKVAALEMVKAAPEIVNKHYPLDDRDYLLRLGHVDTSGWTKEQLEDKYQKSYRIVQGLHRYLLSGPIVKMILEGPANTVILVREIVGKTDPAKSPPGSIRGDLGEDSFEKSDKEGRSVYNLVHASGTDKEAQQEIKLWFNQH